MRLTPIAAGWIAAAAAVAQPLPLPQTPPGASVPEPPAAVATDIALAYTSDDGSGALRIESWDAAGATVGGSIGMRVDYFTIEPAVLELAVGASFPLSDLRLVAHGLNGGEIGGAPLKLTLEAPESLVDVALARESQRLLATGAGIGRLWIEALLPRGTGTGEHFVLPVVIIVR
jgi:hypothetical protein